jgi:DNA replication ATP-dependent helicase Dna2
VISEIVHCIGGTVLLGAFTNTALDKMLLAVLERDPGARFLRIGRASDSPEVAARVEGDRADYFSEDLAQKLGSVAAMKEALKHVKVVAATAHRASTNPFLRNASFDMAVVDEAGQLTEPLTLGIVMRAKRFVLIGDDRQLPPVVRTRELAFSMFERLKGASRITLLDTQYRMHPEIMQVCNRLFYDGRLRAGVSAGDRTPSEGMPVMFVPVDSDTDDRRNICEAETVSRLVRTLVQAQGIAPETIGVISPYRAQVVLMRQILEGSGVVADTVERFQGGERDIVIISFVRSQSSSFVFDERRLNVAMTRARRQLILVAHPELFRNSRYAWISTFTETLRTAGTT